MGVGGRRGGRGRSEAELALEDFAGRVAGQGVEEDEVARDLGSAEALAAPELERSVVDGAAGPLHDEGANALAPLRIFDAHDRDLRDVGVGFEHALDLGGVHVDAPRDDHVALATLDEEAAVAVASREVADAEEAVLHALTRRLGVVVVAGDEHLVAGVELAHLARSDLVPAVVEQADFVAGQRLADASGGGAQIGRLGHRDEARLGRAVAVEEDVAEVVHELRPERTGKRRADGEDAAHRSHVDVPGYPGPMWEMGLDSLRTTYGCTGAFSTYCIGTANPDAGDMKRHHRHHEGEEGKCRRDSSGNAVHLGTN